MVKLRLEAAGYRIAEARTGTEGFTIATESPPVLIITDYQMPLMSGVEMARQLREHGATASVPVLLVTARGYVLDPKDIGETNIRAVIAKPFGLRQLQDHVAKLLKEGAASTAA